jgi:hypothetical protein
MKDEEYVLRQENREKAITARSARSRRTHCGKGGRVKLPSDYMTKKELNKMNGEVEVYRLNSPMKWAEFKAMPDEHKVTYIKLLRNKWDVPDAQLASMFDTSTWSVCQEMKRLNLNRGAEGKNRYWDKEGFLAWWHGVPAKPQEPDEVVAEEPVEAVEDIKPMKWDEFDVMTDDAKVRYINQIRQMFNASDSQIALMLEHNRRAFSFEVKRLGIGMGRDRIGGCSPWDKEGFYKWIGRDIKAAVEVPDEESVDAVEEVKETAASEEQTVVRHAIPDSGSMTFEGKTEDILRTLSVLLSGAKVHIGITWDLLEVDDG